MLVDELLGSEDRPENIFPGFLTIGTRGDIGENDRNSNPYKGPHTPMHVMNSPPESILTQVQNAGNSPGQRGFLQVGPVARKMLLFWPSGPNI